MGKYKVVGLFAQSSCTGGIPWHGFNNGGNYE